MKRIIYFLSNRTQQGRTMTLFYIVSNTNIILKPQLLFDVFIVPSPTLMDNEQSTVLLMDFLVVGQLNIEVTCKELAERLESHKAM